MERLKLTTIAQIKSLANEGKSIKEIADIVGKPYPAVRYHAKQAEHYSGPSHEKTIAEHDARMRAVIDSTEPAALTRKTMSKALGINPTALSVWLKETQDPEVLKFKTESKEGVWKAVTIGVLHYGEGYSYERISHIKHISVSTVQNQINKIKKLHLEPLVIARIGVSEILWTLEKNSALRWLASDKTAKDAGTLAEVVARMVTSHKWEATKKLYSKYEEISSLFELIETFGHGDWDVLAGALIDAEKLVKTEEPKLY